jgi:3-oxoacyl-[acyl-carrier-protein] synthase III
MISFANLVVGEENPVPFQDKYSRTLDFANEIPRIYLGDPAASAHILEAKDCRATPHCVPA